MQLSIIFSLNLGLKILNGGPIVAAMIIMGFTWFPSNWFASSLSAMKYDQSNQTG